MSLEGKMATYLLTWNPDRWPWDRLDEVVEDVRRGGDRSFRWSSGNTTTIQPTDRVFFLKQGKGSRGIFASGRATSKVRRDRHWDRERARAGEKGNFVDGQFEALLNPYEEPILPVEVLEARVP